MKYIIPHLIILAMFATSIPLFYLVSWIPGNLPAPLGIPLLLATVYMYGVAVYYTFVAGGLLKPSKSN